MAQGSSYYVNSISLCVYGVCVCVSLERSGHGSLRLFEEAERLSSKRECSQLCLAWMGVSVCLERVCVINVFACLFTWDFAMFSMCEHDMQQNIYNQALVRLIKGMRERK